MLTAKPRPSRAIAETLAVPEGLIVKSEYGLLRISAVREDILRVTFTLRDHFLNAPSPFLENRPCVRARDARETEAGAAVDAGAISARVNRADGAISFFDKSGAPLFRENGPRALEAFESQRIARSARVTVQEISTADGKKTVVREAAREAYKTLYRARLPLAFFKDEAIYGLGQPENGPANLRGRKLYGCQANRSIAVPFLVSTRGYGLLLSSGSPFIFNDEGPGAYLYAEAVEELEYFVIVGGCEAAVKGYHFLSGKPALLPRWAFGYIQSQERYETQAEVVSIAREYRARGIGLDCVVMDWSSWPAGEWGQKSFDRARFPDPKGMTDALHGMHARFMVSIWPNPNRVTADCAQFREKNLLLPGGTTYDAANPNARATYWEQASRGLFSRGVDAWWCDSSEPWTSEWARTEPPEPDDVYRETRDAGADALGADLGNAYAYFHAQGIFEGQRRETREKRVVNLTRSGWLGQQKFGAILWSGDISAQWRTLRAQIAIGLDISAGGFPYWTQDIGGFFVKRGEPWYWDGDFDRGWDDPEFVELFVRWYQYAAFLPVFRGHGTDIRRELWNAKGESYQALLRANRARYELLPYLYSLAGHIALRGGLMMKPPAFMDPRDENLRGIDDEFLLGDDILVCPVTEYRARSRRVYLPKGAWYNRDTGEKCEGGRFFEAEAPLDRLPVFVRAGAILPLFAPAQSADEAFCQPYRLMAFPGENGKLSLYEDAGDGDGWERGEYAVSTFALEGKEIVYMGTEGDYPGRRPPRYTVEIFGE